jgi:transcriptional regulator with XRE-family HTH domain
VIQVIIFVNMKKILENIRTLRESKGYSQDYMAVLMGITQSAYARFERGATKTDLQTISSIAQVLKMNLIDVITYPEKYVNSNEISKETTLPEPEVILQIKVIGEKKAQILQSVLGNGELEFLK